MQNNSRKNGFMLIELYIIFFIVFILFMILIVSYIYHKNTLTCENAARLIALDLEEQREEALSKEITSGICINNATSYWLFNGDDINNKKREIDLSKKFNINIRFSYPSAGAVMKFTPDGRPARPADAWAYCPFLYNENYQDGIIRLSAGNITKEITVSKEGFIKVE